MRSTFSSRGRRLLASGDRHRAPSAPRPGGVSRASLEYGAELGHERLVGEIEPQRRHRDAFRRERRQIGAVAGFGRGPRAKAIQ